MRDREQFITALDKRDDEIQELKKLLRECKKVMKADNLHRGNPDRRGLWKRIVAATGGVRNAEL